MEHIKDILERGNSPKTTGAPKKFLEEIEPDKTVVEECEELKAKYGYAPNPHCPVCKGFGRTYARFENGKIDYSKFILCTAKGCEADQKKLYESTEPYIKEKGVSKFNSFGNWKPVLGAESALEAFRDIAYNADAPPLLLVYGTTGNGKTHLCEATVVELLNRGVDCRLWVVADLVAKLKASIPENTTELLINKLKTLPALMLDEWGQNYGSDWEIQKLEEIVIARDRAGLITIVTTNLEPDSLPERVISRARDSTQARIIRNAASDFRPKKKTKTKAS